MLSLQFVYEFFDNHIGCISSHIGYFICQAVGAYIQLLRVFFRYFNLFVQLCDVFCYVAGFRSCILNRISCDFYF